ncbi:MAG: hypothetical protein OEY17_05620 [Nitrosopumilus sp.]|nr:hypothetical protein [Nitrosopumilus sp.]MDH5658801.1 hypothetical protein [Nitrosopumilus sp.]
MKRANIFRETSFGATQAGDKSHHANQYHHIKNAFTRKETS